jgi:hypothetical protein
MALVSKGFPWRGSLVGLGRDLPQLLSFPLIWLGFCFLLREMFCV